MPENKPTVMISSTSLDLPEHRKAAMEACLRQGLFPIAMEHLPARDADAIRVSMEMVDKADVYVGVFAWRYGYVPEGHDISITEMEFERAVERGLPILVFTIHKDHPLTIDMVQADTEPQQKLKQLKERACAGRGRLEFKSPEELRGHLIQSLGVWLKEQEAASAEKRVPSLHPPNIIPTAPAPYLAHPYSLLQTKDVIGRQPELKLLTDWVTTNITVPRDVRLFNVVAIGGMGKSALTWKWFNEIAPNELPHLHGRMWWSFYESDAYFENFVIRALAYTSGMTETEVRALPSDEREDRLFRLLDERPFLLVLDGLERILLAYARMDAAHLADDDLDDQTSNYVVTQLTTGVGVSNSTLKENNSGVTPDSVNDCNAETPIAVETVIKETYLQKHRLRQCADPRARRFLQRLTNVNQSRALISTRLYPADLQTNSGQLRPGSYSIELTGLSDSDALALWRAFIGGDRRGTSQHLLPYFQAFGNYPLLLRALAGEVAEYRPAPGDFDRWLKDHPDFNPIELDLRNAKKHVLHFALEKLSNAQKRILHTLAAFRMPATWSTLCEVLIGETEQQPCRDQHALVKLLTELEDRGLVGWNKIANRYDLHTIVRGTVWGALDNNLQRGLYTHLHSHFKEMSAIEDYREINTLEDLTFAIELYSTLVGLERYDDALAIFRERISEALLHRLSANRQRVELLKPLFPNGLDQLPQLRTPNEQAFTLNALALGFDACGQPGRAAHLYRRYIALSTELKDEEEVCIGLSNLSNTLRLSGALAEAEAYARRAVNTCNTRKDYFWEAVNLQWLGAVLAARGEISESASKLQESLHTWAARDHGQAKGVSHALHSQRSLWTGEFVEAKLHADRAWELAHLLKFERDFIGALRLQGVVALELNNFVTAGERLHHALTRARQVNYVEEALPALIALAELRRREGKPEEARELLAAVWDAAALGPYTLLHADAFNVLAQLERDAGQREAAVKAATEAYRLAWCDGPPYAYHWGLTAAARHLDELEAPHPLPATFRRPTTRPHA